MAVSTQCGSHLGRVVSHRTRIQGQNKLSSFNRLHESEFCEKSDPDWGARHPDCPGTKWLPALGTTGKFQMPSIQFQWCWQTSCTFYPTGAMRRKISCPLLPHIRKQRWRFCPAPLGNPAAFPWIAAFTKCEVVIQDYKSECLIQLEFFEFSDWVFGNAQLTMILPLQKKIVLKLSQMFSYVIQDRTPATYKFAS